MAQHEHNPVHDTPPSGGFAVWLKRLRRLFRSRRADAGSQRIKHDIERLEKERLKEKTALLKQRRFYENLLRRRGQTSAETSSAPAMPAPQPAVVAPQPLPTVPVPDETPVRSDDSPAPEKKQPAASVEEKPKPDRARPSFLSSMFKKKTEPTQPKQDVLPADADGKSPLTEKLRAEREDAEKSQQKNEVEQRSWQPFGGIKTNLVKDQGVLFFNWRQRLLMLSLALILCTLAISLIYVGLLVWQKERLDANKATFANFDAINTEISKNEKEIQEIVSFNRKLELVSFVLSNHVYWSNFLGFLEDTTLKDVYLQGLSADLSGTYSLPAVARNLDTVSLQLELYKAYPKMRTVTYSNAQSIAGPAGTEPTTRFTLQMSIDPAVFIK